MFPLSSTQKNAYLGFALFAFVAFAHTADGQNRGIDASLAKQYFQEARQICEHDGGKLWGKSLCGPMLFADPGTRSVTANQPDAESRLTEQNGIFTGSLPPEVNIANTALSWAGVRWTMIMWPLPASPTARARLMMHEVFHRLQDELGLPALSPANAHLGTLEGRIWLQLEWRALEQALARTEASPAERRRAVTDALLFRMQRRALFPKAAEEERQLELNEGLSEYTGYKLRGTADAATAAAIIARLSSAESEQAFSRSFAYVSGPAYGMLLDMSGVPWRKGLTATSDLGDLLRRAYSVTLPDSPTDAARQRSALYDADALRWFEKRQEEQRNAVLNDYKRRLVTGPVLALPLGESVNFSFDPNGVIPVDDASSVYPTLRISDVWGILEVNRGALMVREHGTFARVVVEAPKQGDQTNTEVAENGWKLSLAPGWLLSKGSRPGDFTVEKK